MHLAPQIELFVIYAVMALVLVFRPQGLFTRAAAAKDLTWRRARSVIGTLAFLLLAAVAPALPAWLVSLATIAFANALVVLGLIILWRAGLVPFGQALFYCIGAYAVALIGRYTGAARRAGVDRRGARRCPGSPPSWSASCSRATAKSSSPCSASPCR